MRLIDADALKRDICQYCNDAYSDAPCEPSDCEHMRIIDNQPAIDAVEVVHGRWIEHEAYGCWYYDCSNCDDGYAVKERDFAKPSYCSNCGAKMEGERKDE